MSAADKASSFRVPMLKFSKKIGKLKNFQNILKLGPILENALL